jgi:hypothetical protein
MGAPLVARKKSLTSQLYSLARTSNNLRAISRGPGAYAKRVVRRKVYGRSMGLAGGILKAFGLKR